MSIDQQQRERDAAAAAAAATGPVKAGAVNVPGDQPRRLALKMSSEMRPALYRFIMD